MFIYLVVIAWIYVVLMASVAEAVSTTGTVLGAIVTFVLYGLLPLGIVVYIIGTPGRKRALRTRALAEQAQADTEREAGAAPAAALASTAPDADGKPPAGAEQGTVAAVRKEA